MQLVKWLSKKQKLEILILSCDAILIETIFLKKLSEIFMIYIVFQ